MIALGWLWAFVFSGLFTSCLFALFNTGDTREAHMAQGLAIGLMVAAVTIALVAGMASLPGLKGQ